MLPCLRAAMGDWVYYVTLMTFSEISKRITIAKDIHKHTGLKELLQRTLTDRSKDISEYLCSQDQRFFNAVITGVYLGEPSWCPISVGGNETIPDEKIPSIVKDSIGVLTLTGEEKIFAIDGQHRVEGIKEAISNDTNLKHEEQTVIFVGHQNSRNGLERTRRLFSTLNRYAKPVTLSEIIAIDEDDIVAIITRQLLENHELLSKPEIISVTKSKTVPRNNKKCLTSIHSLYEINDIILFSESEKKDFEKNSKLNDLTIRRYQSTIKMQQIFGVN